MTTASNLLEEQTQATAENVIAETAPPTDQPESSVPVTVIEPRSGWQLLDLRELYQYRDLFRFLIWRSIKVRYAQSAIGIGWAVIQPLFSMVIFTVVFGKLAGISSDGAPYAVFSFAALVPWTYFSNALTEGVDSLVSNANMLRKVYFPRLLLPLSAVAAKLLDFTIAGVILAAMMAWYGVVPTWGILLVPGLILLMMTAAVGASLWLTALAVQYRDIKHAMNFVVQLLMYAAPVVYPTTLIPTSYSVAGVVLNPRLLYALNPMVGVIEGFRAALLGTTPMPWDLLAVGTVSATVLAVTGMLFFRSKERLFADVA